MKTLITTLLLTTSIYAADITLSWNDNSDNENGFKIERKTPGTPFVQIATTGEGEPRFTDGNVQVGSEYTYRVKAYNLYGDSGYTNEATHTVVDPKYFEAFEANENPSGLGSSQSGNGNTIAISADNN